MMKHPLTYFLLLLATLTGHAQTGNQNFVLSRTYKQSGAAASDVSKVNIQVQYLDGLGRPLQTVSVGQSTSGTDLILPMEYDAYGRQPKAYLPYVSGSNGGYQENALKVSVSDSKTDQQRFYSDNTLLLESSDLGRPFSETVFENAPSARPVSVRAPGNKSTSGSIVYSPNSGTEVKHYVYTAGSGITDGGTFAAGKLDKKLTTDENAKTLVEFTDFQGRLICKKAGSEALATYYVYDDYGLLRAVLQPEYQDNASVDFVFLYDYDERGRVISKQVPGAGKVELVYDKFDRLVMSQDANQRARTPTPVWGFIKYDALNRKIMDGEFTTADNRSTLQAAFNASSGHHETTTANAIGYTFSATLPNVGAGDVLNAFYYDDYSFPSSQAYVDRLSVSANGAVKAQQTGSGTRMLNTGSAWLVSTTHYDAEYRPVQSVRQLNDLGTINSERISTKYKYDLAPVIDQEKTDHESSAAVTNSHLKTFSYDHADRLLSVKEKVTLGAVSKEVTTVAHRYNTLGQLQSKWLHSEDAVHFRRRTDYVNNIRGLLTDGKTVYKKTDDGADLPFFAYGLSYANSGNYTNGNISQAQWSGKDEAAFTKGLTFSYDGVNRLTASAGLFGYADLESGITYKGNGNIKTLTRAGVAVDNLTYNYVGNRLSSIDDASGNNSGVKSGSSSFSYDGNGNMTTDGNRGAVLTYNYLNLPETVAIAGKTLTYDYDASGSKHKYVADTLTVKYEGSFEYNGLNVFSRLGLAEGQAVFKSNAIAFEYYVKDHLGNVRVVFNDKGDILQKNDYYSFGLEIDRNSPIQPQNARNGINRYSFQGQERQIGSDYVQFKWRLSDPLTGRFLSVDPLGENFQFNSTYAFAENRVINGIELEGLEWENFMSKFKNPNQLAVKPIPTGQGVQNQSYQVVVQNPKKGLSDLRSTFRDSPQKILSNSKADFQPVDGEGNRLEKADLKKGSYLEIGIAGPMNNSLVKVTDEDNSDDKFSYTFRTLEGHIEAGQITFSASKDKNGNITFGINSTSKVDMGMAPEGFSRNQQAKSWQEVLTNAVKYLQGTETKREVKTKEQK